MPFRIEWFVEGRVIYIVNEGLLTAEDLHQQNDIISAMLDSGTQPIHIITNNTRLAQIPNRLQVLTAELRGLRHPNVGWMVFITSRNRVVRFLYRTLTRIFLLRYEQATSLVEALNILREKDKTINGQAG